MTMKLPAISLAAVCSLAIAGPSLAQDPSSSEEAVAQPAIRETDGVLTCMQIADEAAQLSQTMGQPSGGGVFGVLGGVARSGAAMLVPGAGLLMAGADVVTQPGRDRRENAEVSVQQRWYYLNGLYAGRRCNAEAQGDAPAETASTRPALATPAPSVTPSAATTSPAPAISPVALTAGPK